MYLMNTLKIALQILHFRLLVLNKYFCIFQDQLQLMSKPGSDVLQNRQMY